MMVYTDILFEHLQLYTVYSNVNKDKLIQACFIYLSVPGYER